MLRYIPWIALGVYFIQRSFNKKQLIHIPKDRRKVKIGFVGFSTQSFDRDKAQIIIEGIFESLEKKYPSRYNEVEIVAGLTDIGIPGMVYAEAQKRKLPTTGFACSKSANFKCFPCDNIFIIGHNWGDESNAFLDCEQSKKEYDKCTKTKSSYTWN